MISEKTLKDIFGDYMSTDTPRIIKRFIASGEVVLRSDVEELVEALEIARVIILSDLGTEIAEIEQALEKFREKRDARN